MTDQPPPLLPLLFLTHDSHSHLPRETTQIPTKLPKNFISTQQFLFLLKYTLKIITLYLLYHDSYLCYIDTYSLAETPNEPSFSILFTSPLKSNEPFRKNIYPATICIPIANVLTTVLKKHLEENNLLPRNVFTPLHKHSSEEKPFSSFSFPEIFSDTTTNLFEILKSKTLELTSFPHI